MRMRERVLNRGIPAPRDTLLLQVSQKHNRSSMFFLRFRVRFCAHESPSRQQKSNGCVPSIPSTPQVVIEARKPRVGWPCRLHRTRGTGARCQRGWPRTTTEPPRRVRGAASARRGPEEKGRRCLWRFRHARSRPTVSVETTGNRKTHTIHTMPTAWCGWDEKTLYSARKGENVCPTAHERQNAYYRYHAYQVVVESMRLGGEETRSDPYHARVCGKQTFGPRLDLALDLATSSTTRKSASNARKCLKCWGLVWWTW